VGVRKKFKMSSPGNVFVPHKERRGTDIDPEKLFSDDLRQQAISENGVGKFVGERYGDDNNSQSEHKGLTNPAPIITPANHRGPSNMVKVNLADILPYKEVKDEATLRREKLVDELNEGFDKAINRYEALIIRPQKEIVMEAVIDSQMENNNVNAAEVLEKLNAFGENMANEAVATTESYDPYRGQYIAGQRTLRRKKELAQYGHYLPEGEKEDILDPGKQKDFDNTMIEDKAIKGSISIDDLLSDNTPTVKRNEPIVRPKTEQRKEEPDSIAIDPSMLL